jgi:hypothetical protein
VEEVGEEGDDPDFTSDTNFIINLAQEGLLLALDWEKAFDRVSWEYYHLALEALQFGPHFRGWAKLLANSEALPIRRIKANGKRSNPFSIKCGVPQGCPLSPLAFLVVAEALTRLIQTKRRVHQSRE